MAGTVRRNGVRLRLRQGGPRQEAFYDRDGASTGAVSAVRVASLMLLATGSDTATLVDCKTVLVAHTSVIAPMKLEPHKVEIYRSVPQSRLL